MLLAIDIGNTNSKFAVYDGDEQRGIWRVSTDRKRTADEYAGWLLQLMEVGGVDRRKIDRVIISSVVPEALFNLTTLARRYFAATALIVGEPGVKLGIEARIDQPSEAGADRLVNAVAAHAAYEGPLIVVDFGTATTFDLVDDEGNYCGGVISPGINLSLEALYMTAAKLPHVAIKRPAKVIGTATVPAMQSGIFWGYVGLIEGIVTRMRAEYPAPLTVVATGGLAMMFSEATDIIKHIDPDLTLKGLVLIDSRNRDGV
jgi:type III pantothenate kinase